MNQKGKNFWRIYGKTEGFFYVTSLMGLNTPNTGTDDDDDDGRRRDSCAITKLMQL